MSDSKLHYIGVSRGTETGYFGEILSLPVNATGDIIVEAEVRQRRLAASSYGLFGVGVNQSATFQIRYGVHASLAGTGNYYREGRNNAAYCTWPGFPSKIQQNSGLTDILSRCRVVRKNGYMFLYIDGFYVGQYAYATTITTVDFLFLIRFDTGTFYNNEAWAHWIKVTPSSVVL